MMEMIQGVRDTMGWVDDRQGEGNWYGKSQVAESARCGANGARRTRPVARIRLGTPDGIGR